MGLGLGSIGTSPTSARGVRVRVGVGVRVGGGARGRVGVGARGWG